MNSMIHKYVWYILDNSLKRNRFRIPLIIRRKLKALVYVWKFCNNFPTIYFIKKATNCARQCLPLACIFFMFNSTFEKIASNISIYFQVSKFYKSRADFKYRIYFVKRYILKYDYFLRNRFYCKFYLHAFFVL